MTTKVTHPQKLPAATRQEKVLLAMHQIAEARKEAILIAKSLANKGASIVTN